MLSVAFLHSIDAAAIANQLCSKITDTKNDWSAMPYPILNEGEFALWEAIRRGTLKTNIVVFLASEQFVHNNKVFLSDLVQSNTPKYRYIVIKIGRSVALPKLEIPIDIEMCLEPSYHNYETMWEKCIIDLQGYCKIVEVANKNNENIKKEKKEHRKKQKSLMFGTIFIYLVGILCAMVIVFTGSNAWSRSSAEMILVLMSIISALFISIVSYFVFSGMQKKRDREDQTEFGNDLDMALSNGHHKISTPNTYDTALSIISSVASPLSHDLLDAVFSLIKSRVDEREVDTVEGDPVDVEMSRTIGTESYLPLGHLKLNWKQMKGYYDISKKQATSAFVVAIIICFIGIAIFTFSVVSPLIPAFASNSVLIPIVGTISGAIVELFAGTILIVYKKTLSQMNLYHEALSDYQRYLSCINLVSMISDEEKRDLLYNQIIMSEMSKVPTSHNSDVSS